jgi:hypothetical protein
MARPMLLIQAKGYFHARPNHRRVALAGHLLHR